MSGRFSQQRRQIVELLQNGFGVTARGMFEKYDIQSLAARIFELRAMGYVIESRRKSDGENHWVEYYLISSPRPIAETAA